MTGDRHNPSDNFEDDASRDPSLNATEAVNRALDMLFTEARKLLQDMKDVLRQLREQDK